jgi:hypothetical protein
MHRPEIPQETVVLAYSKTHVNHLHHTYTQIAIPMRSLLGKTEARLQYLRL